MLLNTFNLISIFAFLSAVINALGIYAVFKNKGWVEKVKNKLMCFAAGVLISTPLIFAFPKAVEKNSYAGLFALFGFLFMFLSNHLIRHKIEEKNLAFGITAAEGIAMHSFIDGVIYSATFNASILIGFLTAIGLVIHEFAEGVIIFSTLIKGGMKRKKAAFYSLMAASLTTPIGAFIAYPFVEKLDNSVLGLIIGFVVGVLIYISSSHLLPEAREKEHSLISFLVGVCLSFLVVLSKVI